MMRRLLIALVVLLVITGIVTAGGGFVRAGQDTEVLEAVTNGEVSDLRRIDGNVWSPEFINRPVDRLGRTLVHTAVMNSRYPEVLIFLLQNGGRVDQQDNEGRTPLHHAADQDNLAAARALISAGARLDLKNEAGLDIIAFCKKGLKSIPQHQTCEYITKSL